VIEFFITHGDTTMTTAFFTKTPAKETTTDSPTKLAAVESTSEGKNYTIYVPQGRGGRLDGDSISLGFDGLYTDGISTCNILITLSESKIELVHFDNNTVGHLEHYGNSMQNLSNPNSEIILITRESSAGRIIEGLLTQYIKQKRGLTFTHYRMTTEDGIRVSFDKSSSNTFHPQICFYPIGQQTEAALLHHPQEQPLVAVQKLEQIIGVREKKLRGLSRPKKLFIFDCKFWETIDSQELEIANSHPITQEELNFFNTSDTVIEVASKLSGLINSAEEFGIPSMDIAPKDLGLYLAYYLEGYLNQYEPQMLFGSTHIRVGKKHYFGKKAVRIFNFKYSSSR
jgi:hypothetical protein